MKVPNVIRKLYLGFVIISLLLIGLIGLTFANFVKVERANHWNLHTYEVLIEIDNLTEDALMMTRNVRIYALTGETSYRAAFTENDKKFYEHLARARELTRDNPAQQKNLGMLETQHRQWHRGFAQPLLALRARATPSSNDRVLGEVARITLEQGNLVDGQRNTLGKMEDVERALLARRQHEGATERRRFEMLLVFVAAVVILLTAFLTIVLSKSTLRLFAANTQLRSEFEERERAQQALSDRQQFLNALLDNMNAGVFGCDAQGKLQIINRAAREFPDLAAAPDPSTPAEVMENLYLADGETRLKFEDFPMAKALRGENLRDFEIVIKPAKSPMRVVTANATAITDAHGNHMGAMVVVHDVTQRKRAEQEMHETLRHARCILWYADIRLRDDIDITSEAVTSGQIEMPFNWQIRVADKEAAQHVLPLDVPEGSDWYGEWLQKLRPEDIKQANARSRQALLENKPFYEQEFLCTNKFGEARWLREEVSLQKMDEGRWRAVGFSIDVTERRRAVDALRVSEERFELAMRGTDDGIWDWNLITNEVYFSPRWKSMLGYEEDEIKNELGEWERLVYPDDLHLAYSTIEQYLEGRIPSYELEHRLLHKDGTYRWILTRAFVLRDENGTPQRMVGSHLDLTQRKATEAALRDSEEQLRQIFENASDVIYKTDASGHFTFFNSTALRILNRPAEEIRGLRFTELIHPDYRDDAERFYGRQSVRRGRDSYYEYPAVTSDGATVWFGQNVHLLLDRDEVVGFQAVARDITDRKIAEAQLEQQKSYLRQVIDAIPGFVLVKDWNGKFILANKAIAKSYGTTVEDAEGKTDADFISNAEEVAGFLRADRQVMTSGQPMLIAEEQITLPEDAQTHWLQTIKVPLETGDGGLPQVLCVAIDITQRRQAELALAESQERFRRLAEGAFEGIVVSDMGVIVDANNKFAEMFGYDLDEVHGMNALDFTPPELRDEIGSIIAVNQENRYETTGLRNDGSTFPMEVFSKPIPYQGRVARITALRDITERKEVERMKNEFVSTVSHELRTPLTSIRGSLGLVVGGVAGELPQKARGMIDIAYKNSERLVRLINDILDIEKIESGKMTLEMKTLPLLPLVETAVEANRAYAQEYGVRFVLDKNDAQNDLPQVQVNADSDRLMQVLANLLSNAAKFSPRDGTVTVSVQRLDNDSSQSELLSTQSKGLGKRVRVSVRDEGSGIPEEFKARIFGKFAQADASDTRQKGGTGLGLSISKAIVEKMGGEIGFESTPGQGTTFYFELPENAPLPSTHKQDDGPRILVCEDDEDVAALLEMMLRQDGFSARVAHTTEQARQLLDNEHFDGMTLDLMLPDKDGITFLRELRESPATRNLPIVVVSAQATAGRDELEGEVLGVADWLNKPIKAERLVAAVENAALQRAAAQGRPRILHVEDDPDVRRVVEQILQSDAEITAAVSLEEAHRLLQEREFDLVVLDLKMPDGSGVELLERIREKVPRIPIVIFSAFEYPQELAQRISATLVKSRTSNEELFDTIKGLLGGNVMNRSKPEADAWRAT